MTLLYFSLGIFLLPVSLSLPSFSFLRDVNFQGMVIKYYIPMDVKTMARVLYAAVPPDLF